MTRYVLAAQLGTDDTTAIPFEPSEQLVRVNFLDDAGRLRHGIGRVLRDLKKMNLQPTAIGLDLLVVAVGVYAADTRISRSQVSQDNWTREFRLVLPVSDPAKWNTCRALLCSTLRFLTGDLWDVTFRSWPPHLPYPIMPSHAISSEAAFDCVSLFSGGLDSLIGSIDSLEAGSMPLFASHGGDGAVSSPQAQLFAALSKLYAARTSIKRLRMAMRLEAIAFPGMRTENTTRGRSFLFFALGAMAGSALGKEFTLRVPENGLISLNVPLDATRLGSASTRTTHPYYIHRWNELLASIGLPCTVYNPYWNKTKGEMIRECANQEILGKLAAISVSCAHPSYKRYAKDDKDHCGTCVPCIIRRASFASSPIADPTAYRARKLPLSPSNGATSEGQQVRAFQYALSRLDENPSLAPIWIHKPGPLVEDNGKLGELAAVYSRGMAEIRNLLKGQS